MDLRDEFIRRVVNGRSFAEVGGLWGTVNEKVSVALRAGARSATMIDVTTAGTELWTRFDQRLAELGIPKCAAIAADICQLAARPDCPDFEVVHCSGVIYHHPSPLTLLLSLRKVTSDYLVLTSAVQQERIENQYGTYLMPPSGVLFVPALSDSERQIMTAYWKEKAGVESCLGITETVHWDANDFGPWWWLPTPKALAGMSESCGFHVMDQAPTWNGNASTLLLKAR